jgi:hypothetical protein
MTRTRRRIRLGVDDGRVLCPRSRVENALDRCYPCPHLIDLEPRHDPRWVVCERAERTVPALLLREP